jgi:hypothetical protein
MMTYQDTAITAEITPTDDTMVADRDHHMPPPGSLPGRRHTAMHADTGRRMPLVLVVEDGQAMSDGMRALCDFIDISLDRIDCGEDLLASLQRCRPMAVIAAMDAERQDGGNVLMTVARHDPTLPVLLMTDGDPVLEGAADAVTELWGLTEVVQAGAWPSPGRLAEFLCRAGLRGNCLALLAA